VRRDQEGVTWTNPRRGGRKAAHLICGKESEATVSGKSTYSNIEQTIEIPWNARQRKLLRGRKGAKEEQDQSQDAEVKTKGPIKLPRSDQQRRYDRRRGGTKRGQKAKTMSPLKRTRKKGIGENI